MATKNYSETDIANLIDAFNAEVTKPEAEAPKPAARRTRIVEDERPVSGYRVVVPGMPDLDVDAKGPGEAVVIAQAIAKTRPDMWNYGGYIFLWNYYVVDSEGTVFDGQNIREDVQRARIAGR
jgi:hypothetical protein